MFCLKLLSENCSPITPLQPVTGVTTVREKEESSKKDEQNELFSSLGTCSQKQMECKSEDSACPTKCSRSKELSLWSQTDH